MDDLRQDRRLLDSQGFAKKEGVFSSSEMQLLRTEMNRLRETWNGIENAYREIRNPHLFSQWFRAYIMNAGIFEIAGKMLGEDVLVVGSTCFFKGPRTARLPLHQDNYDIGVYPGTTCAVWISVNDATPDNGALIMVPRSHNLGMLKPNIPGHKSVYGQTVPLPRGYWEEVVPTCSGDIVFFRGDTLHGSLDNKTTDSYRYAFVIHCAPKSIEKIYVLHDQLMNQQGNYEVRRLNKEHGVARLLK